MTITIPNYQIKEELFRSPRTLIYRALRDSDQTGVIIKTLNSEYPSNRDLTRVKYEFYVIQKMAGAGVVQAYEQVKYGNNLALVLADFQGVSLYEYLSQVAVVFAVIVGRIITAPIVDLNQAALQVAGGDFNTTVTTTTRDEIGSLADAFNTMANQVRESMTSLEGLVARRTRSLEIVAELGSRFGTILSLDDLLVEVINQIQDNFDYYHAHIYLLDDAKQNLIMVEGAGQAGVQMKAQGHSIPYNTPTSLVARAARLDQIVFIANVREAEDWLPNPLLPNTYAEVAVPISASGQVVGVLDVQEDKIAGLDESDASLLRSLANYVAVGVSNARLFAEVEDELARARAAQQQYVAETWSQSGRDTEYRYLLAGTTLADDNIIDRLEKEATRQNQLALVPVNDQGIFDTDTEIKGPMALVAPIKLQEQTIGTLQFQNENISQEQRWGDQEMELVQTIIDQVAQSAENLRLFNETRERADYEQLIGEVTQKIRQAPDLTSLTQPAAEAISTVLGVSDGMVQLNVGSKQQSNVEGNGNK